MPARRLGRGQRLPERRDARLGHAATGPHRSRDADGCRTRSRSRCRPARTSSRASRPTQSRWRFSTRRATTAATTSGSARRRCDNAEQVTNTQRRLRRRLVARRRLDRLRPGLVRRHARRRDLAHRARTATTSAHARQRATRPTWAPDGKQLAYFHNGSVWTIGSDGEDAQMLVANGDSPAWSRDGEHDRVHARRALRQARLRGARVRRRVATEGTGEAGRAARSPRTALDRSGFRTASNRGILRIEPLD